MKINLLRASIIMCFISSNSFSSESLFDIYTLALQTDPKLRQAQINVDIAREERQQDFSRWLPSITLTGDITNNSQKRTYDVSQFDGEEEYKSYGYTLSINQSLLSYESNILYRKANDKINQVNTELRAAKQALIIRVSERYFDVLSAEDNLRFSRTEQTAVDRQLKQTERRLASGMSSITAVYEARAQRDTSYVNFIEAENKYDISLQSLREITNQYHNKIKPLRDVIELPEQKITDVEKWIALALDNNLDIVVMKQMNQQLKHEISRQRAAHYPTIDLVGRYAKQTSGGGNFGQSNTESRTIGLQFNIPIYQGGIVNSRTKTAVLKYEKNREKLDETMRSIRSQVYKAYRGIITNLTRIKSLTQSVISNKQALSAVETENKIGRRTISDVFRANKNLYQAKRDYERARYDYVLNRLKLKQLTGNLSALDLRTVNQWLASH